MIRLTTTFFLKAIPAIALVLTGCSSSMVFSPAVNLPVKTLAKSQVDVQGSVELLPETRPSVINQNVSPGGSLLIGYGLSGKTAVYAKGWLDFSKRGSKATRSGFSLNVVTQLKQFSPALKLLLIPKAGMALDGKYNGGYGLEIPLVLHYTYQQKAAFYGGFGFMYGLYDFNKVVVENEEKLRSGYAITNHLGAAAFVHKALRVNVELTTLFMHNQFEKKNNLIFSPSIGIGYTIR